MGFMDKLKSVKNMVTGGGAKVTLQVGQATFDAPIPVMVQASVADADMKVTRIYVIARGVEYIDLIDRDEGDKERIRRENETFRQEFVIASAQDLAGGSAHEWTGEINIPASSQPSFQGRYSRHVWEFQAGLDVKGNDPDSGWIEVQLR